MTASTFPFSSRMKRHAITARRIRQAFYERLYCAHLVVLNSLRLFCRTMRLPCRSTAPFVSYERAPLFKEGKEKKYVRCFGSGKGESLPSTVLFFVTRMFSVAIERP